MEAPAATDTTTLLQNQSFDVQTAPGASAGAPFSACGCSRVLTVVSLGVLCAGSLGFVALAALASFGLPSGVVAPASVVPALTVVCVVGIVWLLFASPNCVQRWWDGISPNDRWVYGLYCCQIWIHTLFSLVIPDSYDVVVTLGHGAGSSGLIVGLWMAGTGVTSTVVGLALIWRPAAWRCIASSAFSFSAVACTVGSLLCAAVVVARREQGEDPGSAAAWQWPALLMSRLLLGVGSGCQIFFAWFLIRRLTHTADIPARIVVLVLCTQTAIGSGPLLAALAQQVEVWCSGRPTWTFASAGLLLPAMCIGFCAVLAVLPPLEQTADCMQRPRPAAELTAADSSVDVKRGSAVAGGLLCVTARGFCVAGLEVTTALLLQDFGWDLRTVGLAIGCTFLVCIPVNFVYRQLQPRLSPVSWVRITAAGSLVGSLFLFRFACRLFGGSGSSCSWVLLTGDVLLFPLLYLSESLVAGMVVSNLAPDGSWLDSAHYLILYCLLCNGVGRTLGPWLGRRSIELGSQDVYAMQQMVVTALFFAIFELFVHRPLAVGCCRGCRCCCEANEASDASANPSAATATATAAYGGAQQEQTGKSGSI